MKKLLLLSLLFFISFACKKDEITDNYYRTYQLDSFESTNKSTGSNVANLKGTIKVSKGSIEILLYQNNTLIYTENLAVNENTSSNGETMFMYRTKTIAVYVTAKSSVLNSYMYLTLDEIPTLLGSLKFSGTFK